MRAGIPLRHPERSKMSFVEKSYSESGGTEPKDLGETATTIPNFYPLRASRSPPPVWRI